MKLDRELLGEIDKLLLELFEGETGCIPYASATGLRLKSIHTCKALGLVREKRTQKQVLFELDEKGVFAIQDGGMEKFLSNTREDRFLDSQIKRLTKKRLELEYGIHLLFLIVGALLTFFFTNISESTNQKKINKKIETLKGELNSSISKIQIQQDEQDILIIDIKNVTDSLTFK